MWPLVLLVQAVVALPDIPNALQCGYNETISIVYQPWEYFPYNGSTGFNYMPTYGYCNGTVLRPGYVNSYLLVNNTMYMQALNCYGGYIPEGYLFTDGLGNTELLGTNYTCNYVNDGYTTPQAYLAALTIEPYEVGDAPGSLNGTYTLTEELLKPFACVSMYSPYRIDAYVFQTAVQFRCSQGNTTSNPARETSCSTDTLVVPLSSSLLGTTVSNATSVTFGECQGIVIQPGLLWYLANYATPLTLTIEIINTYQQILDCAVATTNYTIDTAQNLLADDLVCDDNFRYMLFNQPQPDGSLGYVVNTSTPCTSLSVPARYVCSSTTSAMVSTVAETTTGTVGNDTETSAGSSGGLSAGAITGIVLGVLGAFVIVLRLVHTRKGKTSAYQTVYNTKYAESNL